MTYSKPSLRLTLGLLGLAVIWTDVSQAKDAPPPGFAMPLPSSKAETNRKIREAPAQDAWYKPSYALGIGLGIPEILPLDGYAFFGRYFALHVFYMPSLPFKARVEIPTDVISAKQGSAVANPDFTVFFKGSYGAAYGADLMAFPFAGSFFVGAGISQRRLGIRGNAESPILACSLLEAAKEPPCGDPNARLEFKTKLALTADVSTAAFVNRLHAGWFARIGNAGYLTFHFGYARPWSIHRNVSVKASLDSPSAADDEITGALAEIRAEKEDEMRRKVLQQVQPLDEKGLPILAIGTGIRI